MVQMTFKLNCAPEAGSLKNGLHNAITSKIGRQMGAFYKNAFITFSGYNGPFRAKLAHCYCDGAIVLCPLSGTDSQMRYVFMETTGGALI